MPAAFSCFKWLSAVAGGHESGETRLKRWAELRETGSRVICGFITTLLTPRKIQIAVYSSCWLLQRIVLQTVSAFKLEATQDFLNLFLKIWHQFGLNILTPKFPSSIFQSAKGMISLPHSQTSSLVCCKVSECLSREVEPHYEKITWGDWAIRRAWHCRWPDFLITTAALTSAGPFTMETHCTSSQGCCRERRSRISSIQALALQNSHIAGY